jgi:hypothetical protein
VEWCLEKAKRHSEDKVATNQSEKKETERVFVS